MAGPGFHQGFARSRSESRYPFFWDGLIGAWVPFLGVQNYVLYDWSNNRNNGILHNTDWVAHKNGWVLDFNGSTSYVDLGTGEFWDEDKGSVSFWFNAGAGFTSSQGSIFYVHGGSGPELNKWFVGTLITTGIIRFYMRGTFIDSSFPPIAGEWYHIVTTYDGSLGADNMKLYINGALEGQANLTGDVNDINANHNIGRWSSDDHYFEGQVDNILTYDYALSAREVTQLYKNITGMFELASTIPFSIPKGFLPIFSEEGIHSSIFGGLTLR